MGDKNISIAIPEDLLNTLRIDNQQLCKEMRFEIAKKYYIQHNLSLGKAALLAGMNRIHFFEQLMKEDIVIFDYDDKDIETELQGISE